MTPSSIRSHAAPCLRHRLRAAAVLAVAVACSRPDPGPRYVRLAHGMRPSNAPEAVVGGAAWELGASRVVADDEGRLWIESDLGGMEWEPFLRPGVWRAARPVAGEGLPADGSAPQRLVLGPTELEYVVPDQALEDQGGPREGTFAAAGDALFVVAADAPGRDGAGRLREYLDTGSGDGTSWRVALGEHCGDGFLLLPGSEERVRASYGGQSALRLATVARGAAGTSAPGELRVTVDGAEVALLRLEPSVGGAHAAHEIALPDASGDAEIGFSLEGGAVLLAVLHPTIGPAEVGSYTERPWGEGRPDVVVLLADTFRADNLAAYGGPPSLAPNLNALAERSLVFERAWSTSTWTLPSHASLFSGMTPYQAGSRTQLDSLAPEAETVAERLRAAGYRTGAVTEGAFVSRRYGLDQGFEWFREGRGDSAETREAALGFLDADDGRPVFLFVQSYRAHTPYEVSEETRRRLGHELDLVGSSWEELRAVIPPADLSKHPDFVVDDEDRARMRRYEDLYRGASADLDACFGSLLREIERRGPLDAGYLVFTSDHGEAFWEHGVREHGNGLWDEHIRIPLLLTGPAIRAGTTGVPATLLDLAPTIAALTGLPPEPSWGGVDLLAPAPSRDFVFAYECRPLGLDSKVAVLDRRGKVVSTDAPEPPAPADVAFAYDLEDDPDESAPLDPLPAWAVELLRASREVRRGSLTPVIAPGRAALSAEVLQRLRDLGYLGYLGK